MKFWMLVCVTVFISVSGVAQGVVSGGGFTFSGAYAYGGEVKGAPFSAEIVTETTRVLQDGNRIHNVQNGKIYRDSDGRTRNEESPMQSQATDIKFVHIFDPVDHVFISFVVNPKGGQNIANVHHLPSAASFSVQLRRPLGAVAAAPNTKSHSARPGAEQPCPVIPQPENLGTKVIEGFTVVGTKRTNTIPANRIGNEKPIVSVEETWYADELHEVLLSERDDPQSGHTTGKLVNIQRGEQDPLLFKAPADYTVKDDTLQ